MDESNLNTDSILKTISVAIYLIFICSVTYNYAYLWALGLSSSQIPITISDIVNSAFAWIPTVTLILGVGIINELIIRRIEQGKTEKEIIQSTTNSSLWRRIRESPSTFLRYISVIALFLFIIVGQKYFINGTALSAFFIFLILWLWIGEKLSDAPLIRARRSITVQLSIIFLPIMIIFFLALGYDAAVSQASDVCETGFITLNNNDKFSAKILRSFDKGILFKDTAKNEITFLSWPDIKRLDVPYQKKLFYKGLFSK